MYGYNWTFNIIYCNTCQLVSVNLPTPHWAEKSLLILMYCKNLYGYMKVPQLSDVFMIHSVWKLKQESCLRGLVTQFDEGGSQSSHCPVSIKNTPATCHIFTHRSPLTPQPAWWMWPKIQYTLMLHFTLGSVCLIMETQFFQAELNLAGAHSRSCQRKLFSATEISIIAVEEVSWASFHTQG